MSKPIQWRQGLSGIHVFLNAQLWTGSRHQVFNTGLQQYVLCIIIIIIIIIMLFMFLKNHCLVVVSCLVSWLHHVVMWRTCSRSVLSLACAKYPVGFTKQCSKQSATMSHSVTVEVAVQRHRVITKTTNVALLLCPRLGLALSEYEQWWS